MYFFKKTKLNYFFVCLLVLLLEIICVSNLSALYVMEISTPYEFSQWFLPEFIDSDAKNTKPGYGNISISSIFFPFN